MHNGVGTFSLISFIKEIKLAAILVESAPVLFGLFLKLRYTVKPR